MSERASDRVRSFRGRRDGRRLLLLVAVLLAAVVPSLASGVPLKGQAAVHAAGVGGTWAAQTSGTSTALFAVAFSDATHGWAVGDHGTILHTADGTTWVPQDSGTGQQLCAVTFPDATHGWAVGVAGIVHTSTGATWSAQSASGGLNGVAFSGVTHGWAVGNTGTVLHTPNGTTNTDPRGSNGVVTTAARVYTGPITLTNNSGIFARVLNGTTWSPQSSNTTQDLRAAAFPDALHGWVVGIHGTILHTADGGATWSPQISGTLNGLYGVTFVDSSHGWAVGSGGTIVHTVNGGTGWSAQDSGKPNWLYSVHFTDATHGWVVGDQGTILVTSDSGTTWEPQDSGTGSLLWGVSFSDAAHAWAVGLGGTILRFSGTATSIKIKTTATTAHTGSVPILSGAVTPNGMIGNNIVVYVMKPGKTYWTYSSNRTVYALSGAAAWQYKYYFKTGMAKGTYKFKAVLPAEAGFLSSTSASPATVSIRLK